MPRVIAANRIPRVNLANRPIPFRPDLAAGAAQGEVGSISFFTPGQQPANYQTALTSALMSSAIYSALLAYQGPITGKNQELSAVLASASNWRNRISQWGNALYGPDLVGNVYKTAAPMVAPTLFCAQAAPMNNGVSSLFVMPLSNRLMQIGIGTTAGTHCTRFINAAGVASGAAIEFAATGTPTPVWALEYTNAAILLLSLNGAAPYRSTNGGATWAQMSGGPVTGTYHPIGWLSGTTIFMMAAAFNVSQSVDGGVTWTGGTAPAGVTGAVIFPVTTSGGTGGGPPAVAFNLATRRAYAIATATVLLTWDMDNPMAGATQIVLPAAGAGGPWNQIAATAYGLVISGGGGVIHAPWSNLSTWTLAVASPTPNQDHASGRMAYGPFELGDGYWTWEQAIDASTIAAKIGWRIADLSGQFDRYTVTDPNLPNGKKPYIRVI